MASSSYWSIIRPEATTNIVTNPSFEIDATGWTAGGTNTIAQSSAQSLFGVYSGLATFQNDSDLVSYALTVTDTQHTFSAWIYIPSGWDGGNVRITPSGFTSSTTNDSTGNTTDPTLTDQWQRIHVIWTPDSGDLAGNILLDLSANPTAGKFVYVDGVQAEAKGYATTYCDGDQDGCAWAGTVHASKSTRDALSASGGRVLSLRDDLGFIYSEQDGTGMVRVNNLASPQALQVGEKFEGQTIQGRAFTITGKIVAETVANFHSQKSSLISALSPNTVKINERSTPRLMRYSGATIEKEISAVYDGGLEGGLPDEWPGVDYRLRLLAHDPLFYQLGESSTVLDSNDSVTVNRIAVRLHTGGLSAVGAPTGINEIRTIVEDDNYVYVGGDFGNLDGDPDADNIARWDKTTETWSALGSGFDGIVFSMAIAPNGDLYAGGAFSNSGATAVAKIAVWDGSSWSALGSGLNNNVLGMGFDNQGILYVTGAFTTAGGSGANYVASWDGSSWSALSTGLNATGNVIAVDTNNNVHVGGTFTTAGGSTANYIAVWDGSSWSTLGSGLGNDVFAIYIDNNNNVYASGIFTTAGGSAANRIAYWNGNAWSALGSGLDNGARAIVPFENVLIVTGNFTTAGGTTLSDRIAIWNGSTWAHFDFDLPGTPVVYTVLNSATTGIWFGFSTTGTATYAGSTTITYTGTERAYPIIKIKRTGGTSAKIQSLRNETTGAVLYFDYALLDGETLTIDTRPTKQSMTSSFRGNVYGELLPNSDFGSFYLLHGNSGSLANVITCFVNEAGSPTVTATAQWRNAYVSED